MTLAISSHATILSVQLTPGGVFTDVAEQGDVTPPALMRNEFDATTQEKNIDAYVLGVMRRGAYTQPINWLPTNNTHDHITGMYKLMIQNTITGFKIRYPDGTVDGTPWIMSGQVQNIVPKAPVDGKLAADLTIRFSNYMTIGGVLVGA